MIPLKKHISLLESLKQPAAVVWEPRCCVSENKGRRSQQGTFCLHSWVSLCDVDQGLRATVKSIETFVIVISMAWSSRSIQIPLVSRMVVGVVVVIVHQCLCVPVVLYRWSIEVQMLNGLFHGPSGILVVWTSLSVVYHMVIIWYGSHNGSLSTWSWLKATRSNRPHISQTDFICIRQHHLLYLSSNADAEGSVFQEAMPGQHGSMME